MTFDLVMQLLTSWTYEALHAVSMNQVWLKSSDTYAKYGQIFTIFYKQQTKVEKIIPMSVSLYVGQVIQITSHS